MFSIVKRFPSKNWGKMRVTVRLDLLMSIPAIFRENTCFIDSTHAKRRNVIEKVMNLI
jgi:hypothetical protein